MRQWLPRRDPKGHMGGEDLLAKLPGKVRNMIYEMIASHMYIRQPWLAVDKNGILLQHAQSVRGFADLRAGALYVNRQYRHGLLSVLHQVNVTHHRVDISVVLDRAMPSKDWSLCQESGMLMGNGAGRVSLFVTIECRARRLSRRQD